MPDVSAESPLVTDRNVPGSLSRYTTLRLGGPAGRIVTATDEAAIVRAVGAREPVLVLAGGSNVVIGDGGHPGTVLLIRSRGIDVVAEDAGSVTVRVAAGEPWDAVVAAAVERGWSGIECLSGIPGSAGATPIQNVGAYGQEVAETITAVRAYDRVTGETVTMTPARCGFGYRGSVFKHSDRWVVLSVLFRLAVDGRSAPIRYAELARTLGVPVGGRVPLRSAREAVLALRAGKGMVLDPDDRDTWSVGSFFTNPVLAPHAWAAFRARSAGYGEPAAWPGAGGAVKVSAAWLIDNAGFTKGYGGAGGVGVSSKHALALTNRGGGSTAALLRLAREIRDGVHGRFGITLHPEPVLIGCRM